MDIPASAFRKVRPSVAAARTVIAPSSIGRVSIGWIAATTGRIAVPISLLAPLLLAGTAPLVPLGRMPATRTAGRSKVGQAIMENERR